MRISRKALESTWVPECRKSITEIGARFGTHVGVGGPGWPGLAGLPQLTETVSRSVSAGFSYLKVFYPPGQVTGDGRRTAFEIYREHWAAIRKAAGEDTYLLFCDYEPNRAAVGMVDASRVGPDADRDKIRLAIPSVLRAYPLHDRWFAMDGDSYYTGTDIANISQIDGSWPLVRTWLSMTGLSCGAAITSDPWYWEDFKPYWRNVEVLTPPARERTEVLDLGTDKEWPRLLGHVRREWGNSTVALLWNPGTTERTVTLDFAKAGMDPGKRYAVWSFWDDRYLGVAQGSWTTPRLGPAASQHLVFTELDRTPDRPVLIGSNLHIYCGAAEIQQVTAKRSSFSFELTDAGARDGDLYLYSRMQPVLAIRRRLHGERHHQRRRERLARQPARPQVGRAPAHRHGDPPAHLAPAVVLGPDRHRGAQPAFRRLALRGRPAPRTRAGARPGTRAHRPRHPRRSRRQPHPHRAVRRTGAKQHRPSRAHPHPCGRHFPRRPQTHALGG